jgi:hypothetical protein
VTQRGSGRVPPPFHLDTWPVLRRIFNPLCLTRHIWTRPQMFLVLKSFWTVTKNWVGQLISESYLSTINPENRKSLSKEAPHPNPLVPYSSTQEGALIHQYLPRTAWIIRGTMHHLERTCSYNYNCNVLWTLANSLDSRKRPLTFISLELQLVWEYLKWFGNDPMVP